MTNEPAERLREEMQLRHGDSSPCFDVERLDAALVAERRATVERIRAALRSFGWTDEHLADLDAFLDAEAER